MVTKILNLTAKAGEVIRVLEAVIAGFKAFNQKLRGDQNNG